MQRLIGRRNCEAVPTRIVVMALALNLLAAAYRPAGVPDDASLVAAGARIGAIRLRGLPVFDTQRPEDDKRLFRLAKRLHIETREATVADQLLFRSGDLYDPRVLEETARNRDLWVATSLADSSTPSSPAPPATTGGSPRADCSTQRSRSMPAATWTPTASYCWAATTACAATLCATRLARDGG